MDFSLYMPVRVISGEGCVRSHAAALQEMGERFLILTGSGSAKASGALDDVQEVLRQAGAVFHVFDGITANPLLSQCRAAARLAQDIRADAVIGIGGGSVMDAAKAAAWLAANDPDDTASLYALSLAHPPVPLALIGTTAGTGSEVTATAVLTSDADRRKRSVVHSHCYARVAFADPRYTATMSYATTVSTALDALSHTVEGWFSPTCGDPATLCGEKAFSLLCPNLLRLAGGESPDRAMRQELLYGSLWAGLVLNASGTAFPHPFSYILTEDFSIPHGKACAVFLPAFTRRSETFAPERAQRMFALCGGRDRYYHMLEDLTHDVHISMTPSEIEGYAVRWPGLKNFARTPGGFTPADGVELFGRLFT